MGRRICVVGAGVSGLGAIKACLEEGLEPVCFEGGSHIGGLWKYTDDTDISRACVYDDLVMNTSKVFSMYSDFPHLKEDPVFLPQEKFQKYLERYAEHFGLLGHIKFGVKVNSIMPGEKEISDDVKWSVQYENKGEGLASEIFDGVMICTGLYNDPYIPKLPGLENFKGDVVHSYNIRQPKKYQGKTILVIGIGTSAADMATSFALAGNKVLMTRGPEHEWICAKTLLCGLPWDIICHNGLTTKFPNFARHLLKWLLDIAVVDHSAIGITPKHHKIGEKIFIISNEFVPNLMSGKIVLCPNPSTLDGNQVVFEDGSKKHIDTIVFACGYQYNRGPVPEHLCPVTDNNKFVIYKQTFLPDPKYRSLGFIGQMITNGAPIGAYELQARWYTRVVTGKVSLPSSKTMNNWIRQFDEETYTPPTKSLIRYTVSSLTTTLDMLAEEVCVKPNPWRYLLTDPCLAWRLLLGPYVPARYRLTGPGAWTGARQYIMDSHQHIWYPVSWGIGGKPAYATLLKTVFFGIMLMSTMLLIILLYKFF